MPAGEISSMYAIQSMAGSNKKMFPVSTLIEEQATLQSLLSKVGENNAKLKFRYLPDIGTHHGEQLSNDVEEAGRFTALYNESADIIGAPDKSESPFGENFPSDSSFDHL